MILTLTFPAVVYLIAVVLGTIISAICWISAHNVRSSIRWLGASVFCVTWTLLVFFLSESGLIYYVPHLFQTSFISTLLFLPLSFLFVRSVTVGTPLTWKDLIHALPVFLFLIDYSAIYLMPTAEKLDLIDASRNSAYIYQEGWFLPSFIHRPLRFGLFLLYSGLQFRMALASTSAQRRKMLQYLTAQFLLVIYYTIYQISYDPSLWRAITIVMSGYIVFIGISLLFHPRILYSFELLSPDARLVEQIKKIATAERVDKVQQICNRIEAYMVSESPYLQHGYSIHDLSTALRIPSYQLSAILNHDMRMSFNDFLNKHRISYCRERISSGAADLITLEALAFECGFNNRNSFTSAFKRFCGMTPSDFIRLQKKALIPAKES